MSDWDKLMDPAREALEKLIAEGDAMADRIEELEAQRKKTYEALLSVTRLHDEVEANLAKTMDALAGVDSFVRDLSPFADPSHRPATALAKACEVYAELTGGKDE